MSDRTRTAARICCGLLLAALACAPGADEGEERTARAPIHLGWQVPWATQGQIVMALRHTNIPELVGVDLDYVGFTYGGPLNQAALAGEVDVLLTADQPAVVLLSNSEDWSIVARMMYNRVCVYVPVASPIARLEELAGKTLQGPVGAAAERVALGELQDRGVDLADMQLGNLDMAQQKAVLARTGEGSTRWEGADAYYGFDPLPAIFEVEGRVRMLHCGKVVSVVVASREMTTERVDELERFLRGFALGWLYFARNGSQANAWFAEVSRLDVGDEVLELAASVEPNRRASTAGDLRLTFDGGDLATLRSTQDFLLARGIVRERVDLDARIELGPLGRALDADLDEIYSGVRPRTR